MTIAQTILEQLGGNRFIAMTGAKQFVNTGRGLQFAIGRGARNGINKVRVELLANDLYEMRFYKIRGVDVKELGVACNVYAEGLAEHFTEHTGFNTSL